MTLDPLEELGVNEIGITDNSVFAIYKGSRIEIELNKEDWGDTMKRFGIELGKVIPEPDIITKIIKELGLDYYDREGKKEHKQKNYHEQYPNDPSNKTEKLKQVIAYKYSGNGKYKLHESIILNGVPCFIVYDTEKEKVIIKNEIEEQNRIIRPPSIEECPYPAYEFENEQELDTFIKKANEIESIEELYTRCKNFWSLYVDQEKEIITMLAADSILTYFQDIFPIIHYSECVGGNDVGKSSIGYTFEYTGYRVVKGASITGPNYFRIFGTVEPGQCVIIEDEGDSISDNPDKIAILKIAYEYNAKIPRTNMNVKNQDMNWFYPYGYKMILAEKSIREWKAKGLVDRTFTNKCRPGRVKYAIKDVVSNLINKSEQFQKLHHYLLDFRKLMLCYRLVHYKDRLPLLKVNLENRDKELAYPLLQLFHGTGVFDEIKESIEYFINQRHERKANSIEAALYAIIHKLLYPTGKEVVVANYIPIMFSDIWDSIVTKGEIAGNYNPVKPNEYDTREYGKLRRGSLSILISDIFGAIPRHTRTGSELTFDLRKFASFKGRFSQDNDKAVKIEVGLIQPNGDDCDDCDDCDDFGRV
jgi:hypothetical protein